MLSLLQKRVCADIIFNDTDLSDTEWKCSMRDPELPAPQIQAAACRRRVKTCQCGTKPLLMWLLEKVQKLCGRTAELSLKEDFFQQKTTRPGILLHS